MVQNPLTRKMRSQKSAPPRFKQKPSSSGVSPTVREDAESIKRAVGRRLIIFTRSGKADAHRTTKSVGALEEQSCTDVPEALQRRKNRRPSTFGLLRAYEWARRDLYHTTCYTFRPPAREFAAKRQHPSVVA